jgi:hypothetical protein
VTAVDLKALEEEALSRVPDRQGVEFTYGDVTFRVAPARCWPLDVQFRVADGDVMALERVMGAGVLQTLRDAGMTQAGFEMLLAELRPEGTGGPPLPRSSA